MALARHNLVFLFLIAIYYPKSHLEIEVCKIDSRGIGGINSSVSSSSEVRGGGGSKKQWIIFKSSRNIAILLVFWDQRITLVGWYEFFRIIIFRGKEIEN